MPDIKLGSLFDGIGVFPLAASRCGIRPVWASEIEKAPISITKRHFPDMAHLGDITKVDGGKIPPVNTLINAVVKAKPAAAKGQYLKSVVVASTMGPGIKISTAKYGN